MTSTSTTAVQVKPHFSLLATSFAGGPRPRNAAIILAGLWALVYFFALFTPPVLDDADATHAQAARAMAGTGDLVTLHVDGVRYLEKAPLPYWLTALSLRIFGFNTFAVHLPLALIVALLALLGHRWANQAFGSRTAFYTGIAILNSFGVFLFTRILVPEVLLSLLLGASLFAFLRALTPATQQEPAESAALVLTDPPERPATIWYAGPWFYPYVMWATLALAVLTKGLVALVFFFLPTLLYLLLTGTLRDWRRLRPFSGLVLFLAIAAPWHVLAALRNAGSSTGHGFAWFYLWNEHVLRALGRRTPGDYNRMPGYLYWTQHLLWLFPWSLFLPLGITALWRRQRHQESLVTAYKPTRRERWKDGLGLSLLIGCVSMIAPPFAGGSVWTFLIICGLILLTCTAAISRRRMGLTASPFHRIDAQQRSILLLCLFAGVVLIFFSLTTNQEYYTFPAYLPLLLLIAATITRAEQTFSSSPPAQRWIGFAHRGVSFLGAIAAFFLLHGLWASRHRPYTPDIGGLLAHRGIGDYTLSLSHLFDLTTASFAALRTPAVLAILALLLGPALASTLRKQRRHMAATTTVAFTAAAFLVSAHLAFARFAPMLSSENFAATILRLERQGRMNPATQVMIFGDPSFGSSVPFYLGQPVTLVEGRVNALWFGSTFADAQPVFLTSAELMRGWGKGGRKVLFVPAERRGEVSRLLASEPVTLLGETSGKLLLTDRPLDP